MGALDRCGQHAKKRAPREAPVVVLACRLAQDQASLACSLRPPLAGDLVGILGVELQFVDQPHDDLARITFGRPDERLLLQVEHEQSLRIGAEGAFDDLRFCSHITI